MAKKLRLADLIWTSVVLLGLLAAGRTSAVAQEAPAAGPAASLCDIRTSQRVVAIGDVHGASFPFVGILQAAGLVDDQRRWSGGDAILVQLGDLVDRGPDSRGAIDLLMRLEGEAAAAGGRVIALLGNHDVMRMMRDLRYVGRGEYAGFQSIQSTQVREAYYEAVLARDRRQAEAAGTELDEEAFREQFLEQVPLGFVETIAAFDAANAYGAWMRSHAAMARINGIAFVHAGVTENIAALGCEGINARVRDELAHLPSVDDPAAGSTLVAGPDGPLWTTRLVADDSPLGDAEVTALLEDTLGARALVVGHVPTPGGRVRTLYGDRVIQIDTGMLAGTDFTGGRASALEILDGVVTAIYTDRRDVLFDLDAMGASLSSATTP